MAAIRRFIALVDARARSATFSELRRTTANLVVRVRDPGRRSCWLGIARDGGPQPGCVAPARPADRRPPGGSRPAATASGSTIRAVSELERVAGRLQCDGGGDRGRRRGARACRGEAVAAQQRRRARQPREVDVPGRDEPRDPHADDWRHRHAGGARRTRPRPHSSARWSRPRRAPRSRCCRSSATSSTSRRSRPTSLSCHRRRSRCETVVRAAAETFVHTASAKGLLLTWSVDERLRPP